MSREDLMRSKNGQSSHDLGLISVLFTFSSPFEENWMYLQVC